jgi:hypothetical protein
VLKGGVKVCQRQLVNEVLGPLVTNGQQDRGEQGRRVSASRTTVLRDGEHVWRSRRAGCLIPYGASVAAAGLYACGCASIDAPAYDRARHDRMVQSGANGLATTADVMGRPQDRPPHRRHRGQRLSDARTQLGTCWAHLTNAALAALFVPADTQRDKESPGRAGALGHRLRNV